jgi:soluble lytic murein transglycosylase-like protein
MRRAVFLLCIAFAASAFAAGSPSGLLGLAYTLGAGLPASGPQSLAHAAISPNAPPQGGGVPGEEGLRRLRSTSAAGWSLQNQLPSRLEELLLKPEVAMPAPALTFITASGPVQYDDLWDRISNGFAIPNLESPLVDRWQAWYLARPLVLNGIIERSRRYLYHVVEELSRRGMPLELALLPMVESGYNPAAMSSAQAAGMWQFIPSTGRDYGLHQSDDYDARRDIVASTSAALDYLQFLHDLFGDWRLALAGYNWGEKAVAKAIERNAEKGLKTDYLSLTLPEETRNYLPKLQALKNLVAYHHAFGIELEPIANEPYFTTVATGRKIDLAAAARLAGAKLEELTSLNPGLKQGGNAMGATRGLVLPAGKADAFIANFETYKNATQAKKPAKRRAAN